MIQPDDPGIDRPAAPASVYNTTGVATAFVSGLIIGAVIGALILGPLLSDRFITAIR